MKILQLSLCLILIPEIMTFVGHLVAANKQDFLGPPRTGRDGSGRIVGGHNATKGQIPYQAYLEVDAMLMCGGSLIAPNWVLSAAHCAGKSRTKVSLGGINLNIPEDGRVEVQAKRVIQHPSYNKTTVQNDIMLVELESVVEITSTVNIVSLASDNSKDFTGSTARVSGFGDISDEGILTWLLKYVDVRVISNSECQKSFEDDGEIYEGHICTNHLNDVIGNHCYGDSGGPLIDLDTGVQIGIVSFGSKKGCESKTPKGLARVSYFIDWIRSTTGLNL